MSNLEHTTSWQQIQQGVKEAERLIVNKNYYTLYCHFHAPPYSQECGWYGNYLLSSY